MTVPFWGWVLDVTVSGLPSASVSLSRTLTTAGWSSPVVAVSGAAFGLSLTAATLMVTVARPLSAWPSLVL